MAMAMAIACCCCCCAVGPVFQKRPVRMVSIANLGDSVGTFSKEEKRPTRVAFLGEKEPGFPFFDQKKVPGTPGA